MKRFNRLVLTGISLISVVALVLSAGCSAQPASVPPTEPPGSTTTPPVTTLPLPTGQPYAEPVDFVSAVQKVFSSVVVIEVELAPSGISGQPQAAAGTGWVIDPNGIIVTNDHVVDGARTINVTLADGRVFPATAVQTRPEEDQAVLKIAATGLPAVQIGDSSKLLLGQRVAAVGNSLDLGVRVTGGLVSRLGVTITYSIGNRNIKLDNLIETDAVINPGNSGGVLVNTAGEVIGITNAGLEGPNIDVEGFGYAIATNHAVPIINTLISQLPR